MANYHFKLFSFSALTAAPGSPPTALAVALMLRDIIEGVSMAHNLVILFEHPEWQKPLFAALQHRGVQFGTFDLKRGCLDPDRVPEAPLYFNQASPSAYVRGNTRAVPLALSDAVSGTWWRACAEWFAGLRTRTEQEHSGRADETTGHLAPANARVQRCGSGTRGMGRFLACPAEVRTGRQRDPHVLARIRR